MEKNRKTEYGCKNAQYRVSQRYDAERGWRNEPKKTFWRLENMTPWAEYGYFSPCTCCSCWSPTSHTPARQIDALERLEKFSDDSMTPISRTARTSECLSLITLIRSDSLRSPFSGKELAWLFLTCVLLQQTCRVGDPGDQNLLEGVRSPGGQNSCARMLSAV